MPLWEILTPLGVSLSKDMLEEIARIEIKGVKFVPHSFNRNSIGVYAEDGPLNKLERKIDDIIKKYNPGYKYQCGHKSIL